MDGDSLLTQAGETALGGADDAISLGLDWLSKQLGLTPTSTPSSSTPVTTKPVPKIGLGSVALGVGILILIYVAVKK